MMTGRADAEYLLKNGQLKECRICLDNDNPDDMISPCLCSGGSAFVHRKWLNYWRSENLGDEGFKLCNECQFEYIIEIDVNDPNAESEKLREYSSVVTRDLIAIMLLSATVIFFAFMIFYCASNGTDDFVIIGYLNNMAVILLFAVISLLIGIVISVMTSVEIMEFHESRLGLR